MSKSYVVYKDVAPMAEQDASPSAVGATEFSNPNLLTSGANTNKAITFELNRWLLGGEHDYLDRNSVAFWSELLSGADCSFDVAPSIDIQFSEQHSSVGITLVFDETDGDFCTLVNVTWYRGSSVLASVDFHPTGTNYFCEHQVTAFDRIVITPKETSLPYRRAKITHIVFGLHRRFGIDEMRSAKIIQQTSLISTEVPISTFDFSLENRGNVSFMFQLKQPMEVWNDNSLLGVFYIDEHKRASSSLYEIDCYNAIGILDETQFDGAVYSSASAIGILTDIVGSDFTLNFEVSDVTLSGAIMSGTRREAMQQVLFAAGWLCATDSDSGIRIFKLDDTLTEIERNRTFSGVSSTISAIVTEVRVMAHQYAVNSNGSVEINGTKYYDTKTVYSIKNPNVTANDKQSVVEVTEATLVSPDIVQSVAQRVYDYYMMRQTDNAKVVWKGEKIGDYVSLPTAWGTEHAGHIKKMTITLSNTVAADVETVGV